MTDIGQRRVFISHSHADVEIARIFAREIQNVLLDDQCVWYDESAIQRIQPGQDWQAQTAEEVRASQVFIVLLSPASVMSQFVRWELDIALRRSLVEPHKAIVGVLIEHCEIPYELNSRRIVPFVEPHRRDVAMGELNTILWEALSAGEPERDQPLLSDATRARFFETGQLPAAFGRVQGADEEASEELQSSGGGSYTDLLDLIPERDLVRLLLMSSGDSAAGKGNTELISSYLHTLALRVESDTPEQHVVQEVESPARSYADISPALDAQFAVGSYGRVPARPLSWSAPVEQVWWAPLQRGARPQGQIAAIADWLALDAPITRLDHPVWKGEPALEGQDIRTLAEAHSRLASGSSLDALAVLDVYTEDFLATNPGFAMRWWYLRGLAYMDAGWRRSPSRSAIRFTKAIEAFKHALSYAVAWNDTDSQIVIFASQGEAYQSLSQYEIALNEYQTALAVLRPAHEHSSRRAGAAQALLVRIARSHFIVGRFDEALKCLKEASDMARSPGAHTQGSREWFNRRWMEALTLRSVSRARGGDLRLLRKAADLFVEAEKLLPKHLAPGEPFQRTSVARLRVQLAETHLDIAQTHKRKRRGPSFVHAMMSAQTCVNHAIDTLKGENDLIGTMLARLVMLRCELLNLSAKELDQLETDMITHRLVEIEQSATASNNDLLLAHALTLHADLHATRGDREAISMYYRAIDAFERAGARGEASRAVLGLRRLLGLC